MKAATNALRQRSRTGSVGVGGQSPTFTLPVRNRSRRGLTLLEVILALAIFLFSIVAISRLITVGGDRALDIQGREIQLCQAKMAEVASGITPLQSASGTFDEEPDWHWSIDCEPSPYTSLWNVKVTVGRQHADGTKTQTVLTQMVYDPSQRGSTLDPDPTASNASSTSSDSSGDGSSTPSTSSQSAPSITGGSMTPFATPMKSGGMAPSMTGGGNFGNMTTGSGVTPMTTRPSTGKGGM
jgi:prepilin-type N-terminal cleavage/methylation domain-containing protein